MISRFSTEKEKQLLFLQYHPQGNMKTIFHKLTNIAKVN